MFLHKLIPIDHDVRLNTRCVLEIMCFLLQPTIFGTVASDLTPKDGNSRRVSVKER